MSKPYLVIAGASGVVGRHLVAAARPNYRITVLTRKVEGDEPTGARAVAWNPSAAREGDEAALRDLSEVLEGATALVNLAGASIADGRLDEAHKRRVLQSRLDSTTTLVQAFERTERAPEVWFQASAVGYYGDRGEEELSEDSKSGRDFFLSNIGERWEAAAAPVTERARLVVGRLGLVLAQDAPAWQKMLLPIKLFVGGPLGSGRQWYPWIHADDVARAMLFLLECQGCRGVYNLCAPQPVRQIDLARKAAEVLGRPAVLPAPAFALRLALGQVADALLLASTKAVPKRLTAAGFEFSYSSIDHALGDLLA